ncbi:MAG: hypothetical protein AAFV53_02970 [Myxococcota bacterium]
MSNEKQPDGDVITLSRRTLTIILTAVLGIPLGAVPAGAIGWAQGTSIEAYRLDALSQQVNGLSEKVDALQAAVGSAGIDRWTRSDQAAYAVTMEARVKELEKKVLLLEHQR